MLECVEEKKSYKSPSGKVFVVLHLARHAQDCSWNMVVFQNILPTEDAPAGTVWTLAESIFMRTFSEIN